MTQLTPQECIDIIKLLDIAIKHPTAGGFAIAQRACQLGERLQIIAAENAAQPTEEVVE